MNYIKQQILLNIKQKKELVNPDDIVDLLQDGEIYVDIKIQKQNIAVLNLTERGILFFIELNTTPDIAFIRSRFLDIQIKLGISPNSYNVIIYTPDGTFLYTPCNGDYYQIKEIPTQIKILLNYDRPVIITKKKQEELLQMLDDILNPPAQYDESGNELIKKNDKWYIKADVNSDTEILTTALFGWFGYHKFKAGLKLQGLVYALTCGVFGVGYVFDVLYLLIGVRKEKLKYIGQYGDNITNPYKYSPYMLYEPIENKKRGILLLFLSIIISIFMLIAYTYGYSKIFDVLIQLASQALSQN